MDACHHLLRLLSEPLANGYTSIIIVSTNKYEDGINGVSMFGLQLIGLVSDIIPLTTANAIDIRSNLKPILKETPILNLGTTIARISDGVAKISYTRSLPRVANEWLRKGWNSQEGYEQKGENSFHFLSWFSNFGGKISAKWAKCQIFIWAFPNWSLISSIKLIKL